MSTAALVFWQEVNYSNSVIISIEFYLKELKACQNSMKVVPGQTYAKYYSCLHGCFEWQHTEVCLRTDSNLYLAHGQQSKTIKPGHPCKEQ